jgi:tetratricopeptide (TPR) repeat protein
MRSINRCIIPALAVLALLATSGRISAQDWTGDSRIQGKVVDENGQPVQGAILKLRFASENAGPDVRTDKHGEFSAIALAGGTWNIDVEAPGFIVRKLSVSVPGGDGRIPPLDITLKKDVAAEQQKQLQGLLAKGDELYKQGRFAEARAEYEKVLAARPDLMEVHRSIALTYGRQHDYANALKEMDIVLAKYPDDNTLLLLAADAAMRLGDASRAQQYASRLDMAKMNDTDPIVNLAITMLNKNQPNLAIQTLDPLVARFPQAPDPYYYRALAELQLQQMDKARADLEKFLPLAQPGSKQAQQAKEMLAQIKHEPGNDDSPGDRRAGAATPPAFHMRR